MEHGIENLTDKRGHINISGILENDLILFIIDDNGPGADETLLRNILTYESGGYGLKNVRDRILGIWGYPHGLKIESSCEGVTVTVAIPLTRSDSYAANKKPALPIKYI